MSEKKNPQAEKPKAIDVNQVDLDKMRENTAENPGLLPYAHQVGSPVIKPQDIGKAKSRALSAMEQQTHAQMEKLYEQMQLLKSQADSIQSRVAISHRIYAVKMSFEPLIGHEYYMYRKLDHTDTLSLVAPTEWGKNMPFEAYLATVKLMADHTWEIIHSDDEELWQVG